MQASACALATRSSAINHSAHLDTFTADNLPPRDCWPDLLLDGLDYPTRLNAAVDLLAHPRDAICVREAGDDWTYARMSDASDRIARVLVEEMGLVAGNRVLLRGANSAILIAAWLGVLKAGGVVVATMPMLRAKELTEVVAKARISHAITDVALADELGQVAAAQPTLKHIASYGHGGQLEAAMAARAPGFDAVATLAEDVALIAFTSGTTGTPKGCMHLHRDLLATCDTYGRHIVAPSPRDVFIGTAPLAFTFGLGALVLYPLRVGAVSVPLATPNPELVTDAVERFGATYLFTAPTMYRTLLARSDLDRLASLRVCVSAGEPLAAATSNEWHARTRVRIADGIGSTEMLHIFISAIGADARSGATGKPVPGYVAAILGEDLEPVEPGRVGRLAVKGPTGCRYLADERQTTYVQRGWNLTGDAYRQDADGYFIFAARADDMIISAGYNISGPEVEAALLAHPDITECAVVASPDALRGNIVKAFVVVRDRARTDREKISEFQEFVKRQLAPYKYPRAIEFVSELPKTPTGKVQRFKLRQLELERSRVASAHVAAVP